VQVLDKQRHGRVVAQAAKQSQHTLEDAHLQPVLVAARDGLCAADRGQLGDQASELGKARTCRFCDPCGIDVPDQGPQRFDDRTEGESVVAEGDGTALEDQPAVGPEPVGDLRDQPALPDPRLAADHDERGPAGRGRAGRFEEHVELARASDEAGTRQAAGHATDDRRCPSRS
jgi:hypothetical protein